MNEVDPQKLKDNILQAAQQRFRQYGYGKTTMAEIAEDVSMSAANLYRYFQNKQDIAGACANMCMCEHNEHIREFTRNKKLSAAQRLYTFAIEACRHNMSVMKDTPRAMELVQIISANNGDMVKKNIENQVGLIAEILSYGNETGEFQVNDVIGQAKTLYSTLLLFDVPIFLSLYTQEEFEEKAQNIINLIIEGIRKR